MEKTVRQPLHIPMNTLRRARSLPHRHAGILLLVSIFLSGFAPVAAPPVGQTGSHLGRTGGGGFGAGPSLLLQGEGVSPGGSSAEYCEYTTQPGDTLPAVAVRFGVYHDDIQAANGLSLSARGLLPAGWKLIIPKKFSRTTDSARLLPDTAVVFSKSSAAFRVGDFILGKRGYLLGYSDDEGRTGSGIIERLALDNSIDPKILLALLETSSGWVTRTEPPAESLLYPLKFKDYSQRGLNTQLMLAIDLLERGYYGWRDATVLDLRFGNGETLRLAPDLNAGTAAVMYYFSEFSYSPSLWRQEVAKFEDVYAGLFGDPQADASVALYPDELYPPDFSLPFFTGRSWCFSFGPHGAWDYRGPAAAVDLAPPQYEDSSAFSRMVLASASGCIVRSEGNAVVIDLDCDGSEQTGWNLFYYHMSEEDRVPRGTKVAKGQRIGSASCEGGKCTGMHVHMARKYNGEWVLVNGPLPFTISGWVLSRGSAAGEWFFLRNGQQVYPSTNCFYPNLIYR